MRKIICVFLVALLVFCTCSFIACQGEKAAPHGEGVSYCDALERKVTVPKNPKRVAALLGSFADIWLLAGGELCATAEDAWEDFGYEGDAVNLGGAHSPSVELLLASDPELVLASASTASNVEMKDTLERAGITVVYFEVVSFEDYLSMLAFCTSVTEREDLYERNGRAIGAQIEAIKEACNSDLTPTTRRVLVLRAASKNVKAKGSRGTVLGEMLSDMGCINIADSDSHLLENLSVEAIIREDPYRIFVVAMGADTQAAEKAIDRLMQENPAWGTLRAVQEGRVHVMEKSLFNLKPNDRFAEAYEKLYEALTEK